MNKQENNKSLNIDDITNKVDEKIEKEKQKKDEKIDTFKKKEQENISEYTSKKDKKDIINEELKEEVKKEEVKKQYEIEVINIEKYYGNKKVLDKINLKVKKGEIHGLLGPNGAGKTTIMKSIVSLVVPEKGKIFVQNKQVGVDVGTNNNIGFGPSEVTMLEHLTVKDLILSCNYYLKGLEKEKVLNAIDRHAIKKFKLHKISELSTGWRKIVQIFNITLSKPDILILDEPTNGLDATNREKIFRELIRMKNEEKRTILISTHILDDIKEIADSFTIIKSGKTVYYGTKDKDLKKTYETFFPLISESGSKDAEEEYGVSFRM